MNSNRRLMMGDAYYISSDYVEHYGTPQQYDGDPNGSGRYRKGSGENLQRNKDIYTMYNDLLKRGFSQKQIATAWNMSTTELRTAVSLGSKEVRQENVNQAKKLLEQGYSKSAIGRQMGVSESTVRSWLDESIEQRQGRVDEKAKLLKDFVDEHGYVDIGAGVELYLGCSDTMLKNAVAKLEQEGYKKQYYKIDQMGTDHKTTIMALAAPDAPYKTGMDKFEIPSIAGRQVDEDGEVSALGIQKPVSVDSNRIMIRYNENDTGGIERDGLIELRRTPELSLGNARYAQVRIAVDGTRYLKGMAIVNDDMPEGVDIIFNTNKTKDVPKLDVLKPMKTKETTGEIDWDNPFGAIIKSEDDLVRAQRRYTDPKTGEKKLSPINIVSEEGDWSKWDRTIASQVLSKQKPALAKRQLDLYYADKMAEFETISNLTNPTIKRKLLMEFADNCDGAAVNLKAAAFPRQAFHVILPFPQLKDNEIYAPNYKDGEQVCLIRYPHAGTFEIPQLTVRNKGSAADRYIHNARDAVGINSKVAQQLSGADFDDDTVLVIPVNDRVKLDTKPQLQALKDFDPKTAYPGYDGMKVIKHSKQQIEMGVVSNLITDMTLHGAPPDELARAVKHSMVVIDAEKHKLDYKRSYRENGIRALQEKYQSHADGSPGFGAATLISRAKSEQRVLARRDDFSINPETGKKEYKNVRESEATYTYINAKDSTGVKKKLTLLTDKKTGERYTIDPVTRQKVIRTEDEVAKAKTEYRTQKSTKMAEADDAFTLTSGGSRENPGTRMEAVYAEHANRMKELGNQARLLYLHTERLKYSKEAHKDYAEQVNSLNTKLKVAQKNAPLERQAQMLANKTIAKKKEENPNIDAEHLKKYKGQAINAARTAVGAGKFLIDIDDLEWEAIQAGAISDSKLEQILNNTDADALKKRAMPRATNSVSPAISNKIRAMSVAGYTTADIAEACGVSTSTVSKYST